MNAPWQSVGALAWAVIAPPLLVYAATRVRAGRIPVHRALMLTAVVIETAVVISFAFIDPMRPRRAELGTLPIFKIHLILAVAALLGIAWQLVSRTIPRLTPLHRRSGPYVILLWCLALLTGIYNFVFLYVMTRPETMIR